MCLVYMVCLCNRCEACNIASILQQRKSAVLLFIEMRVTAGYNRLKQPWAVVPNRRR